MAHWVNCLPGRGKTSTSSGAWASLIEFGGRQHAAILARVTFDVASVNENFRVIFVMFVYCAITLLTALILPLIHAKNICSGIAVSE